MTPQDRAIVAILDHIIASQEIEKRERAIETAIKVGDLEQVRQYVTEAIHIRENHLPSIAVLKELRDALTLQPTEQEQISAALTNLHQEHEKA